MRSIIPPFRSRTSVLLLVLAAALLPSAFLSVHIQLDSSSPAKDEVLEHAPQQLRLLFSARIEARYTAVTLIAPDSTPVELGPVVFVPGSDREITVRVPALPGAGTYTVGWRTAGADGHVLEGSYAFTVTSNGVSTDSAVTPVLPVPVQEAHQHHEEPETVGAAGGAIGRGLHFLALIVVIGAVAFRVLLLPRLNIVAATRPVLERLAWRTLAAAAVLLGAAALLRLRFQSIALHGADRAWSPALLTIMLNDTGWGRAWVLQALLFAILGLAIAWARPGRDRIATFIAVPAAIALAAIPAFSGHAVATDTPGLLAVINDTIHVSAAGAWLGMLAVLLLVAIPALRRTEPAPADAAAGAVESFSPIALAAATVVVLTGVLNTLMHITAPAQLWETDYGITLLFKIALVIGVLIAGFVNWRVVRPRLRHGDALRRLRVTAGIELTLAALVLMATAVLTGQPTP